MIWNRIILFNIGLLSLHIIHDIGYRVLYFHFLCLCIRLNIYENVKSLLPISVKLQLCPFSMFSLNSTWIFLRTICKKWIIFQWASHHQFGLNWLQISYVELWKPNEKKYNIVIFKFCLLIPKNCDWNYECVRKNLS